MPKVIHFGLPVVATLILLVAGCKPGNQPETPASHNYFQTSFQSESQYIVETIASDLAEQVSYAANHRLPEGGAPLVTSREKPHSPPDAPVYALQIRLDQKRPPLEVNLNVNGPIWSPYVYQDLVAALGRAAGLTPGTTNNPDDTSLLGKLLDGTAGTIERENQSLSEALEKDFRNAALHEQAALLLGAFLFRDHSGCFFELRAPLSRLTAHLAMARFLRGTNAPGINGRLAEAMMLTTILNQAPTLELLKSIDNKDAAVAAMVRALQAQNTGDYRPLTAITDPTPVESMVCFFKMADYVSGPLAWQKLDDGQKGTIDFVRMAGELDHSVEMGHHLLRTALPLELMEIREVYKLSHSKELKESHLAEVLNDQPGRCFDHDTGQKPRVQIIGWGQWANFLQRHLCHAVQHNFHFMNHQWGVPDDAREFAAACDRKFGDLRLYPFVRRWCCTDVKTYHQSVDDGFKVTVATPHLVPASCWNRLCSKPTFAPLYTPNPNPHVNEWHSHNPLPGTDYDLLPRLNHPSLISRRDVLACYERLHKLAPYDFRISQCIIKLKYDDHPTYEQTMEFYGAALPYSAHALRTVAASAGDQPALYEKLMLQAAALDPTVYYELATHAIHLNQEDKAAEYYDKGCKTDPDSVRIASHAGWRVRYYLREGMTEQARDIADFAADVYSSAGLLAKAVFMEATTNYDDAFEWYAKNEQRYEQSWPLVNFCMRFKARTGDSKFDSELQQRKNVVFPGGMEKVAIQDFHEAPTNGVIIMEENALLSAAGLKKGDVIAALDGIRTHNFTQYTFVRTFLTTPELRLIVWQGDSYREIKASPPNHLFGAEFIDFVPK